MKPRKLYGVNGILERCPVCHRAIKAGGWVKDGDNGDPRVLMVLLYCENCKRHIRTVYSFYEQYHYRLPERGKIEDEQTEFEAPKFEEVGSAGPVLPGRACRTCDD